MSKKCFKVHAEKTESFEMVVYAESEDDIYNALDQEHLDDFIISDSDWDIGAREVPFTKIDFYVNENCELKDFTSIQQISDEETEENYTKPGKYDVKLPL